MSEDPTPTPTPTRPPTHTVGIGASAGGLAALEQFLSALPSPNGMAFVVVQHLPPTHKSLLVEILSKHSKLPVKTAVEGEELVGDQVYVAAPGRNVEIHGGAVRLVKKDPTPGVNLPIDVFFRSLAYDQGGSAVGIVLSGTGSDGMRGVRALKEAGGLVLAQDDESAKFQGMPRSAVATGCVDFILAPEQMPKRILQFQAGIPEDSDAPLARHPQAGTVLKRIIEAVHRRTGDDFTYYKPSTLVRRIEHRMAVNHYSDMDAYARLVVDTPKEAQSLRKELLIGVTKFFRDGKVFDALSEKVVRKIVQSAEPESVIRVWVAACSTGEEAYSLAMLFLEEIGKQQRPVSLKVFATDIDRDAIEFAGTGIYSESIAADVPRERLHRFFQRMPRGYQVSRVLRESVLFAVHNVVKDPPFTRVDLVTCRNVLIYIEPFLQRKIFKAIHFALGGRGHMLLGTSETIGDLADLFRPVDASAKIYRAVGTTSPRSLEPGSVPFTARKRPEAGARDARQSPPSRPIELATGAMLDHFVPPALLLNHKSELIHVFGDGNAFLQIPQGSASLQVLKMVPRSMSHLLATAIHKALRDDGEVTYRNVRCDAENLPEFVTIRVRPLEIPSEEHPFALVVLEDTLAGRESSASTIEIDKDIEERITSLLQELQFTKEHLHASIEELETSNEELQATNEELLASNEELQSMNEELESVNEELYTVNAEYQSKITELSELNNDMDNLLRSTNIGTLFLDRNLLIRKFTPAMRELVNIMERDVGRPVGHLSLRFRDYGFAEDVRQALEKRDTVERTLTNDGGQTYLMRILPYVTDDGLTDGVVLTFTNITAAREAEERTQHLLDAMPVSAAIVARDGVILSVNDLWRDSLRAPGVHADTSALPGSNYLSVLRKLGESLSSAFAGADSRVEGLLAGHGAPIAIQYFEYAEGDDTEPNRQVSMTVTPLGGRGDAVVCHGYVGSSVPAAPGKSATSVDSGVEGQVS